MELCVGCPHVNLHMITYTLASAKDRWNVSHHCKTLVLKPHVMSPLWETSTCDLLLVTNENKSEYLKQWLQITHTFLDCMEMQTPSTRCIQEKKHLSLKTQIHQTEIRSNQTNNTKKSKTQGNRLLTQKEMVQRGHQQGTVATLWTQDPGVWAEGLRIWEQPWLHCKFKTSLHYIARPDLNKKTRAIG